MCRMVGVVFREQFPSEVLLDLREVARVGKIPGEKEAGHRDGWGMASFANGSPIYMERRPDAIFEDHHFEPAVRQVAKLSRPNILIAHARASSGSPASISNTHPFMARGLLLAHNGTVFDYRAKTRYVPHGDTESENLLMSLAERMDSVGDLGKALRSLILEDILVRKFSGAVLLVSDGVRLYGYRDYAPDRSAEYYNLKVLRRPDYVLLYQETLLELDKSAQKVNKGELIAVGTDMKVTSEKLA